MNAGESLDRHTPGSMPRAVGDRTSAAALHYGAREQAVGGAPRVVAKGNGHVADEILRRARAAGVPIHASRELVSLLMQVDLDQQIPPALYLAVAEVLAWVYQVERRQEQRRRAPQRVPHAAATADVDFLTHESTADELRGDRTASLRVSPHAN